jgi:hypothetical protein
MTSPLSSIALRVWHPTLPATEIVSRIALPVQFMNSVGEQRRTPKGQLLEGVYPQTYCCFQLKKKAASPLDEDLTPWCTFLEQHLLFMQDLVRSGGRTEFRVGIFLDGDRGFEFGNPLIQRIYALGLGLSIEMYRLGDAELNA